MVVVAVVVNIVKLLAVEIAIEKVVFVTVVVNLVEYWSWKLHLRMWS